MPRTRSPPHSHRRQRVRRESEAITSCRAAKSFRLRPAFNGVDLLPFHPDDWRTLHLARHLGQQAKTLRPATLLQVPLESRSSAGTDTPAASVPSGTPQTLPPWGEPVTQRLVSLGFGQRVQGAQSRWSLNGWWEAVATTAPTWGSGTSWGSRASVATRVLAVAERPGDP